ncbi:invasion associated locus B family protein [Pikeienuella sp. HZG-20]|uniref:invasion associated locus B family protein n=1 Tax=Paludibacillus litoralis TaxID=3133267 RepID=UPI0030ED0B0A
MATENWMGRAYWIGAAMAMLMALLVVTPNASFAQETNESIGAKRDWSIFKQGSAADRQCWVVSKPVSSRALRGGKPVSVNRGDIYLMVAIRPGSQVLNEVSMIGGYPFRSGSSVKMEIGSDKFELFTEGEGAWADSPESDAKIVAAMKRGVTANVTGVSTRGTTTIDRFSLSGFTAALDEARALCK